MPIDEIMFSLVQVEKDDGEGMLETFPSPGTLSLKAVFL